MRVKLLLPAALFVLVILPSLSFANDEILLTKEYTDCMSASLDNKQYLSCGGQEIERQKHFLAQILKQVTDLMRRNDVKHSSALLVPFEEEQEAWTKWEDASCEFYMDSYLGRMSAVIALPRCKAIVIAERVRRLQTIAQDIEENRLGSP